MFKFSDKIITRMGGDFIKPPENPQLPLGDGRGNPDRPL